MPRAFSSRERELIEAKLCTAGLEQFQQQGLRRTNVAALARAAGIAKGSFYLFFPSKEALLLLLLQRRQQELRGQLDRLVHDSSLLPRDRVERFLRICFESFADSPAYGALSDPEDIESLVRALPPGALEQAQADEDGYLVGILQAWQDAGELTPLEPEALVGLVRLVQAAARGRDRIGAERFPKTVEVMVAALSDYLAW